MSTDPKGSAPIDPASPMFEVKSLNREITTEIFWKGQKYKVTFKPPEGFIYSQGLSDEAIAVKVGELAQQALKIAPEKILQKPHAQVQVHFQAFREKNPSPLKLTITPKSMGPGMPEPTPLQVDLMEEHLDDNRTKIKIRMQAIVQNLLVAYPA